MGGAFSSCEMSCTERFPDCGFFIIKVTVVWLSEAWAAEPAGTSAG